MSPTAIIDLQRRLTLVGAIRAGERTEKGAPRKLEHWRITSPRRDLVEQAAGLYGGAPSPWRSPAGKEWQVVTETAEIPVLVIPGYSLAQSYELWEGPSKRTRLCDGISEALSDGPCLCNQQGEDRCDLYTRLVVALPELDTVLGWRLITRGASAGHELPTMMALIQAAAAGQAFVPARLRLDQRRGMKDGKAIRFVVPTVDLSVGYLQLAESNHASGRELPPSVTYTPLPSRETNLAQALGAVAAPKPRSQSGRAPAPIGPASEEFSSEPIHVPEEGVGPQTKSLSDPQREKLNVQVGTLRESDRITTEHVWRAIAEIRGVELEPLVEELGGRDEEGVLHWSPLRESLTRPEASQLIDRLEKLEAPESAEGEA